MSFNRLNYDDCTYKHMLKETIGPGDYMLGTPRVDCDECYFPSPDVILNRNGAAVCVKDIIDVDSELMGITRKKSKCPSENYLPTETPYCKTRMPKDCLGLTREDTRLSNPPCTLRGTGWNRWEWLCTNPQERVLIPFDYNISNRLVVKDNHRPCIPKPLDQTNSLPPRENDNIKYDYSSKYKEPYLDVVSPQLGTCENIRIM